VRPTVTKQEIEDQLLDALSNIDPTLDLSPSSPWVTQLIDPIVTLLGTVDLNAEQGDVALLLTQLAEFNPESPFDEGDAIVEVAVKPLAYLLRPIRRALETIRLRQSAIDPSLHSEESAEAVASNFFTSRRQGTWSQGVVRCYFSGVRDVDTSGAVVAYSVDNDALIPTGLQQITAKNMLLNREGSQYYFDVTFRALEAGSIEIPAGSVRSIEGMEGVVRVTNPSAFTVGDADETATELLTRLPDSLTERGASTSRGVRARLFELLPQLLSVTTVGFGHPDMRRDRLDFSTTGHRAELKSLSSISFPLTIPTTGRYIRVETDDGVGGRQGSHTLDLAGTYPTLTSLVHAINTKWAAAGGSGCIAAGWGADKVMVHAWSDLPGLNGTYQDSYLYCQTHPTSDAWSSLGVSPSQVNVARSGDAGVIISDMPGGILRPNTPEGEVVLDGNSFHIGGCTDVYVQDPIPEQATMVYPDAEPSQVAWAGPKGQCNPSVSDSTVFSDASTGTRPGVPDWNGTLASSTATVGAEVLEGVIPEIGSVLHVKSPAGVAGVYTVTALRDQDSVLGTNELRVDKPFSGPLTSDVLYSLMTNFRLDLTSVESSQVVLSSLHGSHLACYGGVTQANWAAPALSGLDSNQFASYDVQPGDWLYVLGTIRGIASENTQNNPYRITSVSGSTVQFDKPMIYTEDVRFMVLRPREENVDLPLTRVKQVRILAGSGQRTESVIPYGLPVRVESRGLTGGRVYAEGLVGIVDGTARNELTIPSWYQKFTNRGVNPQMVVYLSHSEAFGSSTTGRAFARVVTVTDYKITVDRELPIGDSSTYENVFFQIGIPSTGRARFFFESPVGFSMVHDLTKHAFGSLGDRYTPADVLGLETFETEALPNQYRIQPRSILDGHRLLPHAIEEVESADVEDIPTVHTEVEYLFEDSAISYLASTDTSVQILQLVDIDLRKYLLRDGDSTLCGDVMGIYPERLLGQGENAAYVNDATAHEDTLLRKSRNVARIVGGQGAQVRVMPGFFNTTALAYGTNGFSDPTLTSSCVEGVFGLLDSSLVVLRESDLFPGDNAGTYRLSSVQSDETINTRLNLKSTRALQPTDEKTSRHGAASWDQYVVTLSTLGASSIPFVDGERVTNGSFSAVVERWDGGSSALYLKDIDESRPFPTSGNWTGTSSGSVWAHASIGTPLYAIPANGAKTLTFTGGGTAPGWVSSTDPGPWVVGSHLALYDRLNAGATLADTEDAVSSMSIWKITAVDPTGVNVTVENVVDSSANLTNRSGNLEMAWVISSGKRPAAMFSVYESNPTAFLFNRVVYQVSLTQYSDRIEVKDPSGLFGSYADGRAYAGSGMPMFLCRPGYVRAVRDSMASRTQDGLYYFDAEVTSLSPDPDVALESGVPLVMANAPDTMYGAWRAQDGAYLSDGFVIEVPSPALTFSEQEKPTLCAPPRHLPAGKLDNDANREPIVGNTIAVDYERSEEAAVADAFLSSDDERPLGASILVKHYAPGYVRGTVNYRGAAEEDAVRRAAQRWISTQSGQDGIERSDLNEVVYREGADYVDLDDGIAAIYIGNDRSRTAERSNDSIGGGVGRQGGTGGTSLAATHYVLDLLEVESE